MFGMKLVLENSRVSKTDTTPERHRCPICNALCPASRGKKIRAQRGRPPVLQGRLLTLLREGREGYTELTREYLTDRMGISPGAFARHIDRARQNGHDIRSTYIRGVGHIYELREQPSI